MKTDKPIITTFETVWSNGNYYFFIPTDKYQILMTDDKNIVVGSKSEESLKMMTQKTELEREIGNN